MRCASLRLAPQGSPPPRGEGTGVGVVPLGEIESYDPPPQPSPTRGEGAHRDRWTVDARHTSRFVFAVGAAFVAFVASAFITSPARADDVADFYKGRSVTLTVSSSAGGGYDTLARTVARFLGRHVPGNPTIIVRNMAGA